MSLLPLLLRAEGEAISQPDELDKGTTDLEREFEKEKEGNPISGQDQSERKTGPSEQSHLLTIVDRNQRTYSLDMLAAVDFLGEWDKETNHTTRNQFALREGEMGVFANIDHLAEGTFMVAAHNEGGAYFLEVHEAYFLFPRTPIPRTSLKLGKFFIDAGRLNSIHRHDWPFTTTPLVHKELLAEEAVDQTGAEFRLLFPWSFWQELSIGAFNGKTFGHSHSEGPIKQNPLVNAHLKQFFPITESLGWQSGFTGLRWHPDENSNKHTEQYGFDNLVKWRFDRQWGFQFLTEIWYRETRQRRARPYDPAAPPVETRVGGYAFFELQMWEEFFVAYRSDAFTDPNKRGQLGYTIKNGIAGDSIILSWKPSEFAVFRVTATRSTNLETGKRSYEYYFQSTFVIGKHPAHNY
ncbi:MAG: hypothetical protein K8S54_09570 [Spirochaetia bacterium]|nr:hypothetical protein [Spirochaetia bacterium]